MGAEFQDLMCAFFDLTGSHGDSLRLRNNTSVFSCSSEVHAKTRKTVVNVFSAGDSIHALWRKQTVLTLQELLLTIFHVLADMKAVTVCYTT